MRVIPYNSTLHPTDNEWGVPQLMIERQPDQIIAPIVRWGSVSRKTKHGGTWCFYVDDYRFGVWETLAERVAKTNPAACVEPNYSAFDWTPRAHVLWDIYRKRRIARELQLLQVPVWVDLCMPREHFDLALLGVPKGWKYYATRSFEARHDEIEHEYRLAADHCGSEPIMLVYGGGKKTADAASSLPGTVHIKAKEQDV